MSAFDRAVFDGSVFDVPPIAMSGTISIGIFAYSVALGVRGASATATVTQAAAMSTGLGGASVASMLTGGSATVGVS